MRTHFNPTAQQETTSQQLVDDQLSASNRRPKTVDLSQDTFACMHVSDFLWLKKEGHLRLQNSLCPSISVTYWKPASISLRANELLTLFSVCFSMTMHLPYPEKNRV